MPIDYVITWVDGQDAEHKKRRRFYLEQEELRGKFLFKPQMAPSDFEEQTKLRYQDNGEIYYNIASALLYASLIRRIFIVTDGQVPRFISDFVSEGKCAADYIRLVSHDEIFKADKNLPDLRAARPNFNSLAIESVLWRIPDLSEHFIYGNDDLFFNRPVNEGDFFRGGIPVLYGRWRHSFKFRADYCLKSILEKFHIHKPESDYDISMWRGAYLASMGRGDSSRFWKAGHNLHPLRKSVFAEFFTRHPDILNKQLSFRFRDLWQFNPVSLANNLEIQRGDTPVDGKDGAYLDDENITEEVYEKFLAKLRDRSCLYACVQSLGLYPPAMQMGLRKILAEKFKAALPESIQRHLLKGE